MRGRTNSPVRRIAAVVVVFLAGLAATLVAPVAASAAGVPVLTTTAPSIGFTAGGATVTLTGSGFTGATSVTFGGVPSPSVTVVSDTDLSVMTPPHPAGVVAVIVSTPSGSSTASASTAYTFTGPYVVKVAPNMVSVAGGTTITVTGSGFANTVGVDVGTTPAVSFTKVTNMVLTVVVPAQSAGVEDVRVTTSVGTSPAVTTDHVTYVVPAVTIVMPYAGPANHAESVELTGVGLIGATQVDFGSVSATSFVVHGPTKITAMAPAEPAGMVAVTVTSPAGVTAVGPHDYYTYRAPAVTRVMPNSGPAAGGTRVLISGTLFAGVSAVTFGGVPASFVPGSGSIMAVSPPGAVGTVDIQVTAAAGTSAKATTDHFTYH